MSPIDGGNLHRSFPGDSDGGPTSAIAHFVDTVLFPMVDIHHDLHAGGSSLQYLPFASMRLGEDPDLNAQSLAAIRAFGAPWGMIWAYSPDARLASMAAMTRALISLGGEFGSGGGVSIAGIGIVERGVARLLAHAGIIESAPEPSRIPTRLVEVKGRGYYAYAQEPGVFEPAAELGDVVSEGQLCGQVYFPDNPARSPQPVHFKAGGIVICKRHFGRVDRGDCVAHLATDWSG